MLVREVVPRVDLKDKHVVDSGLPPSVGVDAQQEDELDQQETAAVDPHQGPNVLQAEKHGAWRTGVDILIRTSQWKPSDKHLAESDG